MKLLTTICALSFSGFLLMPFDADAAAPRKPPHTAKPKDAPSRPLGETEAVRAFAAELATSQGFDADTVRRQLAEARVLPVVQRLIMPPAVGKAKDWDAYRALFIEPRRIEAGLDFWARYEADLARAEERFGVPASVVAGIIGVETFYGRIMGNFSALDALATLSFAFPSGRSDRSPLFRKHLGELFVLARKEGVEPGSLKGSYAGAMGWGQFMPGSWNKYAVDFDGDGHIDLIGNPVDAIGSIANFLAEHGWQRGMPSDYTLKLPSETATRAALLVHDIEPKFSAAQLATRGVALSEAGQQHAGPLAVIELQRGAAAPMYFAGTQNFYVLTRYNQSAYYAMAVIELGRVLAAKRAMAAAEPAAAPRSNCAPADFREVLSLQALPLELRKLLDADQNTADGMAERGAQFNESDVIADNDQRPTRRFVLAALSSDCALVAFEQGGRGKTVRMASFRRGNGRWELGPQTLLRDTPQSVQDLLGQDPGRQGQAR